MLRRIFLEIHEMNCGSFLYIYFLYISIFILFTLYFLCYLCFYTQYGNEKGKVDTIIYFIVRFTKQTWLKYAFLPRKFDFRLAKIRFNF